MPALLKDQEGAEEKIGITVHGPLSGRDCQPELVHVHVCVYCGHPRKREDIGGREMGSGVFHCPVCESDGPLNVEIREA
jgi:hypothetical protein